MLDLILNTTSSIVHFYSTSGRPRSLLLYCSRWSEPCWTLFRVTLLSPLLFPEKLKPTSGFSSSPVEGFSTAISAHTSWTVHPSLFLLFYWKDPFGNCGLPSTINFSCRRACTLLFQLIHEQHCIAENPLSFHC